MVFRTETIATIDHYRQIAEIVVASSEVNKMLAAHAYLQRGPIGVTVHITAASRVHIAVALIRRRRNELLYGWQLLVSGP